MILLCLACTSPEDTDRPNRRGPRPPLEEAEETGFLDTAETGWIDTSEPIDTGDTEDTQEPEEDPCPSGVICVDRDLPYWDDNSTQGGSREFDSYSCASSTDESGPEVIYRVILDEPGFLAADLREMGSGADVDVHVLGSLDSDDCFDRGHWSAGALLPAGTYFVVADTWVNSSGQEQKGDYGLVLGAVTASDLAAEGLDESTAELSLEAFDRAWEEDHSAEPVYGIIDFSLYSAEKRFWLWDMAAEELLWNLHVTHGENSAKSTDPGWAVRFSNVPESHKSSLGMMVAAEDYYGSNGHSVRYDGLEAGYNDNVRSRAIVFHGATYARPEIVDQYGMLGLSWGCTAVDDRVTDDVIDDLMGAYVWSYYPDGDWSVNSTYLP